MTVTMPLARTHPFDPPADLVDIAKTGPLTRLRYPDGHLGWLATGYFVAREVLFDKRFSALRELQRLPVPWKSRDLIVGHRARPGIFIGMDPPEHTRYRRVLASQFTVRKLNELKPHIEEIVKEHLDAMTEAGPPVDLVEHFALPIPTIAICELLGVPIDQRDAFHHANMVLNDLDASAEEGARVYDETIDRIRALIREKRQHPTTDFLGELAATDDLNEDELAGVGMLLLLAGSETTANMLALGTFALLSHPGQLDILRDHPESIDNYVEELLRYHSILQFSVTRVALEDIKLESGQLIEAGETVTVSIPAANRDPEKFEDPDALDLNRATSGHLAFGYGVHQCIGQHLARIEMRVGYPALFDQFPDLRLAVPAEQVPLRSNMGVYGVHSLPVSW